MSVDRFATLLYGIGEAAGYLSVPPSTLTTRAYGYERRRAGGAQIPSGLSRLLRRYGRNARNDPAVPFIGLAEAYALAAFRSAGVPMQRVRPAVDALARELGPEHALASRRLCTDGAEVLVRLRLACGHTP